MLQAYKFSLLGIWSV